MVRPGPHFRIVTEVSIPVPKKGTSGYGVLAPKDPKRFAKELKRIIREGGDIQMVVDNSQPITDGVSIGFGYGMKAIGDKGFWMSVDKDTLEAMIKALQLAFDNYPVD